jgi:uncharacterized alpha-E superfamily protein
MISRVADHCFWFGRYLERAESTARLLQTSANLALDGDLTPIQVWHPVVITAGEEEEFIERRGAEAFTDGESVQEHLSLDREVGASIIQSVKAARENARSVREVISLEVWETINELHLYLQSPLARDEFNEHRYGFYKRVRKEAQLTLGLLRGTMLHDTPLHFIWLGTLIERTGQTARILDVHHHAFSRAVAVPETPETQAQSQSQGFAAQMQAMNGMTQSQSLPLAKPVRLSAEQEARQVIEVSLWLSLLRACYGFEPFLKLHRGAVTGEAAAHFLIFEPRFPRSVHHCVTRVRELLEQVRPEKAKLSTAAPSRSFERVRVLEEALGARVEERFDEHGMHALLTEVVDQMHAACDELSEELLGPPAEKAAAAIPVSPARETSLSE